MAEPIQTTAAFPGGTVGKSNGAHDVYIVETPQGYFRVLPAVAIVARQVTFRNMTNYTVYVDIDNGTGGTTAVVLGPLSKNKTHPFHAGCYGRYFGYSVSVEIVPPPVPAPGVRGTTVGAVGESDPKIIVDA